MKSRPHPNLTRMRIMRLQDRTELTTIPTLEHAFGEDHLDPEMCRMMIDTMTFSTYPGAKEDGARALSAFLGNSRNFEDLRLSGGLGAIIEQLRCIEVVPKNMPHVKILVNSLHQLCISEDTSIIEKLISNPYGISIILRLCLLTHGEIQLKVTEILVAISKLDNGITGLVSLNVMDTLMTAEMLFRPSTCVEVRHSIANLINRITCLVPAAYPFDKFLELSLDSKGKRRIDAYQEIQFLQGLINYWTWLSNDGKTLDKLFTYFSYLLHEMEFEQFDSLDHCVLITKCLVLGSRDVVQIDYMLKHDLAVSLQYLVRTDFTLYRKRGEGVADTNMKAAIKDLRKKTKKLSFQDSGNRSDATLMALTIINPPNKKGNSKATEETNIFATKAVITIYENILDVRAEVISDIISSGLLPALIYKVGFGTDKDYRYLKIAVQFVHSIVTRVISLGPLKGIHMSLLSSIPPRSVPYVPIGEIDPLSAAGQQPQSFPADVRAKMASTTDMRLISNTFNVQGITEILLVAIAYTDDNVVVQKALTCLSILDFQVIKQPLYETIHMNRIFSHCISRVEWHYPSLSLIIQMMSHASATEDQLTLMAMELKGLKLVITALRMTTWEFPFKGLIYDCLVNLCHIPHFRTKIAELGGLSPVITAVLLRKVRHKAKRRARLINTYDEGTEKIYAVLRRDISALRIQNIARIKFARAKVARVRSQKGVVYKSTTQAIQSKLRAIGVVVGQVKAK